MSRITTCPNCATRLSLPEGITEKTLICPHCLAEVDSVRSTSQIQAPQLNTDVKRDMRVGNIVLAVLVGLCLLGIVMAIKDGWASVLSLGYSCAALDVFVSIAIIRWGISSAARSAARVVGVTFMVLGTTVAIFIFFFFACASLYDVQHHGQFH